MDTSPDECGFTDVVGGKIWYRIDGIEHTDKTPVLIVHGGPGMSHDYLLSCRALANERTVVMYDQLDTGKSTRGNDPAHWTIERFTDEIDCLRQALKLDQVHVLGSSWGGTLAVNYARRQPAGLRSMLLSGPMLDARRWVSDNEMHRQALPSDVLETLLKHEAQENYNAPAYQEAVLHFYRRHFCRMETWPEDVQRSVLCGNGDQLRFMWGPTEFLATGPLKVLDLTSHLPDIEIPTLFVSGQYDESTPAATAAFASLMPAARAVVIPGAAHMPHVEAPDIFFAAVRSFFSQHDR